MITLPNKYNTKIVTPLAKETELHKGVEGAPQVKMVMQ